MPKCSKLFQDKEKFDTIIELYKDKGLSYIKYFHIGTHFIFTF